MEDVFMELTDNQRPIVTYEQVEHKTLSEWRCQSSDVWHQLPEPPIDNETIRDKLPDACKDVYKRMIPLKLL